MDSVTVRLSSVTACMRLWREFARLGRVMARTRDVHASVVRLKISRLPSVRIRRLSGLA